MSTFLSKKSLTVDSTKKAALEYLKFSQWVCIKKKIKTLTSGCGFASDSNQLAHRHSEQSIRQRPGRLGFNPKLSHIKDSKRLLDASLLNTQHYNGRIKSRVEQSSEKSCILLNTSV